MGLKTAYTDLLGRLATPLDLASVRDIFAQMVEYQAAEPDGVLYDEGEVAGRAAVWCRPRQAQGEAVIAYLHGGGYRALTHATVRKLAGHLAAAAGLPVVSVGYCLAPEHPWPAALHDATAILAELAGQSAKIVLAGESAGGSLAISTALAAHGSAPRPAAIVAFSPYVDLLGEDAAFASENSRDAFLSRFAAQDAARMLLAETTAPDDPIANLRYADPSGLPPLFVAAGGAENLADGIGAFAERARQASVSTTLVVAQERQHAYVYSAGRDPEADATLSAAGRWIRATLGLGDHATAGREPLDRA
jgi:acetyl esterase/lipase